MFGEDGSRDGVGSASVVRIRNAIYYSRTSRGTEPFQCARKPETDVVQP